MTRVFRLRLELCLAGGARQGHLNTVHYRKNDNLEYRYISTIRLQRQNESRQLKERNGKKLEKYRSGTGTQLQDLRISARKLKHDAPQRNYAFRRINGARSKKRANLACRRSNVQLSQRNVECVRNYYAILKLSKMKCTVLIGATGRV